MFNILKELCNLQGVSGNERLVRDYIIDKIKPFCEYKISPLGNIIVHKSGAKTKQPLLIAAHMDEVGFIVTNVNKDGFIKLAPVGGIVPSAVFGKQIKFTNGQYAVIGGVPVHHLTADEKDKQPDFDEMWADSGGAKTELGDTATFVSEYTEFGNGCIKSKAIDDRLGCALIIDLLQNPDNENREIYCAFTVQEETGARGAATVVQNVNDFFNAKIGRALIIEATTACDIAGISGENKVCRLGKGAVVPFMDGGTVYDREMLGTAKSSGAKIQTKTKIAGGTDAGVIHKSLWGVPSLCISAPCRYLHTGNCVIKKDDVTEMRKLIGFMIQEL
jgi:endoglucanase